MTKTEDEKARFLLAKYDIKYPPFGFYIGEGWLQIVEDAFEELLSLGWDKDLAQVKEKFGGLRIYIEAGTRDMRAVIMKAEEKAWKTCEECGAPGTLRRRSWWKTLCDDCENRDY